METVNNPSEADAVVAEAVVAEVPKLILHSFDRGKTCPNVSPFVLKLETYLRMADIPYLVGNGFIHAFTSHRYSYIIKS